MALNHNPDASEHALQLDDAISASLGAILDRAASTLREHTDEGWIRARSPLLAKVLSAARPSTPVRGRHAHGTYYIATVALSHDVRRALESHASARLLRITFDTDTDHALTQVTAQVSAAFGEPLIPLADNVRRLIAAQLRSTLGIPRLADTIVWVDLIVTDIYAR